MAERKSKCVLKSWYCAECRTNERLDSAGYTTCECGKSRHLENAKLNG